MKTATKLISLVTCLCLLLCAFAVTAAAALMLKKRQA